MAEINTDLLSKEDLVRLLTDSQNRAKRESEEKDLARKRIEEENAKLKQSLEEHKTTLDKVRFPGVQLENLPNIAQIAEQVGQDTAWLEYCLDKYPDKFLMAVESNASGVIATLKQKMKDSEVDISGASLIELITDQEDSFWNKYSGPETIDNEYPENLAKAKNSFFKMKNQYVEVIKYQADISDLQDCRYSAYLHFRKRQNSLTELISTVEEKEEDVEVTKLKSIVDTLSKKVEELQKQKEVAEIKKAEQIAEEEQQKLAAAGSDSIREEEPEEEESAEEDPKEENEVEKPKQRGRPKVIK